MKTSLSKEDLMHRMNGIRLYNEYLLQGADRSKEEFLSEFLSMGYSADDYAWTEAAVTINADGSRTVSTSKLLNLMRENLPPDATLWAGVIAQKLHADLTSKLDICGIEQQNYRKPDDLVQCLTKVTDKIFSGDTGEHNYSVGKRGHEVPVYAKIDPPETPLEAAIQKAFLREVFAGVCSIVKTGQMTFTAKQVYEAMTGSQTTSKTAINDTISAMETMRTMLISLDYTDQMMAYFNLRPNNKQFCYRSHYVLPCNETVIESNGQIVAAYELLEEPVLYVMSKDVKQISETPKEFLQIPGVSNTADNIVLKNYLIRQIEHMKNDKAKWLQNGLTFEEIWNECQINTSPQNMGRRRETLFLMLNCWKEKGFIRDYTVHGKGKTKYYKLRISVDKTPQN